MKKLVLSVALGMFCYCISNAMEPKEEIKSINDVLLTMLKGQNQINEAKNAIKELEPRIYSTIKDEEEKVKKGKLLEFITSQINFLKIKTKDTKVDKLKFAIKKIEQYFHLEEKENDYECTKDNLTEIFWNNEQKEETQKIEGPIKGIQIYFLRIANTEEQINNTFKEYYKTKMQKKAKEGEEKKKEEIIEEIMKECCEGDKNSDPNTNFLAKLKEICENEELKKQIKDDEREAILKAIQRRITLTENITKDDLRDFIKQKIGPLDEKANNPVQEKDDKPKGEKKGCCSCCDCLEEKENKGVEVEESQYEKEE